MSLIDEALKRARMEAAQKAAEEEGLPYPTIPRHVRPPRRRGWLAPVVVVLAAMAGILVGVLLTARGGPATDRVAAAGADPPATGQANGLPPAAPADPVVATSDATSPAAGAKPPSAADGRPRTPSTTPPAAPTPGSSGLPAVAEPGVPEPMAEPPTPAKTASGAPRAQAPEAARTGGGASAGQRDPPTAGPAAQQPPAGQTSPPTTTRAAAPVPAPPTSPPPTPPAPGPSTPADLSAPPPAAADQPTATTSARTDPESGVLLVLPERADGGPGSAAATPSPDTPAESHVQQVALADGATIELGGIAWSETGPFALINGRVVSPGAVISGYTVESIRPGHVELAGEGRRIRLTLQ